MKKVMILIFVLVLSSSIALAQTPIIKIIDAPQSVRELGTADVFSSDSDDIDAGDIYTLKRSFLSAGHSFETTDGLSVLSFGVAINPSMFLGVIGAFDIDFNIIEDLDTTETDYFSTEKTYNEDTQFRVTAAFGWEQMGFHYTIARGGNTQHNSTILKPMFDGKNTNWNEVKTSSSAWLHEISFAMKLGESMKFDIPIGVILDNNANTTNISHNVTGLDTRGSTNITGGNAINIYLNPTFSYLFTDAGPLTELEVGLTAGLNVYDTKGMSSNLLHTETTTYANGNETIAIVDVTNTQGKNTGFIDMDYGIFVKSYLEWNIANDQLSFIIEPSLGFDMTINSDGKEENGTITSISSTTENTFNPDGSASGTTEVTTTTTTITTNNTRVSTTTVYSPYIEMPMGVAYSPVEWIEIRTGLNYKISFNMTQETLDYSETLQGGASYSTLGTEFNSEFQIFAGVGFIVAEDFFIDVALNTDPESFLNFNEIAAQLSYRF